MEDNAGYIGRRIGVPTGWDEVFSHFYHAENAGADVLIKNLPPDFSSLLVFVFGEPLAILTDAGIITVNDVAVTAPLKQVVTYTMPQGCTMLVATFKDDAFYRFFKKPMSRGKTFLHPDELMEAECFTALHTKAAMLREPEQQIDYILNYAQAYLIDRDNFTESLAANNNTMFNPVKVLAEKQGITERSIQLHYRKYLGYTAKELARYTRFNKVLEKINELPASEKPDWHDIVETHGYYDQSHLISDFKYYIGLSPVNYLKLQREFCFPA